MKSWHTSTALATLGLLLTAASSSAQDIAADDLLSLSLAELSNIEVTSVSRTVESQHEAAAAVYVITQEDIRRSGLTSIPELLRMVPGLNVAQSGAHQWAISSRGLSGQFADTLLVLIDGRTIYTPIFSGVYWDVQDTLLEDIERIEVIRGPGATLWGANAVNGVINIITKSARDTQGGYLSQTAGNQINSLTSGRYGAKVGDNAYMRAYAKYDDYDEFENMVGNGAGDEWNKSQAGFRSDWNRSENELVTIQGDLYRAGESYINNLIQPAGTTIATNVRETDSGGNILGRWNKKFSHDSDLTLQMYYDDARRNHPIVKSKVQTFDIDMQHNWLPAERHEVVWGAGYRLVKSNIEGNPNTALGVPYIQFNPASRSDNLFSAFVQDKITLLPKEVFLTLGSKFEHNDFTGFEMQPSARVSWLVDEKQTLWASVSHAVRTPNIGSTTDLRQVGPAAAPGVFFTQVGNPDGVSEELNAYEIGYRIQPEKNISIDLAAFYNDYSRLIIGVAGAATPYGAFLIVPISPENIGTAHAWGGEATAKWNPNQNIELAASYSLLQMEFDQLDPLGYNFRGKSPEHMFNARATFDLPYDLQFTASAYFVDRLLSVDPNTGSGIPGYTRFDTRLAWMPLENLEVSLVGQNLLDDMHQEFSGFAYQNSSQVPRTVYGNITWKF